MASNSPSRPCSWPARATPRPLRLPSRLWSSPDRRRRQRSRPFRELPAQSSRFLKTDRYIAQDRRDPLHSARKVPEWQNRELDRDAPPIFSHRRHRQNFAGAVTRAPALHRRGIARPVTRAEALGNNDVEGLAQCFGFGKAEDPLRTKVPKTNDSLSVRINDRVGGFADDGL